MDEGRRRSWVWLLVGVIIGLPVLYHVYVTIMILTLAYVPAARVPIRENLRWTVYPVEWMATHWPWYGNALKWWMNLLGWSP